VKADAVDDLDHHSRRCADRLRRELHPMSNRDAVYYAVHHAVKINKLVKPAKCDACNAVKPVEAHHHLGYAPEHWLDVQWLCRKCHKQVHPEVDRLREGQRKGVQTRLVRYTSDERIAQGRQAWATRVVRLSPDELAAQIASQANKCRGAKRTPEARQRMSDAHKGQVPWNKGKTNA
jgi:hypothetical protein